MTHACILGMVSDNLFFYKWPHTEIVAKLGYASRLNIYFGYLCIKIRYLTICTMLVRSARIMCFLWRLYDGKLSSIVLYIYCYLKGCCTAYHVWSSNTELYMYFESRALVVHIFLSLLSINVRYFYTLYMSIVCIIIIALWCDVSAPLF